METTRTTAGYKLWSALSQQMDADKAIKEVQRRVKVRTTKAGEGGVRVETSTDGGPWVDEGLYKDS